MYIISDDRKGRKKIKETEEGKMGEKIKKRNVRRLRRQRNKLEIKLYQTTGRKGKNKKKHQRRVRWKKIR